MISANAVMTDSYDYGEVARSILIAIAASCCARPCGTSHRREGLGTVSLVDRWRHCDGLGHLGDAHQGDAGLPPAGAGQLPTGQPSCCRCCPLFWLLPSRSMS